MRESESETRLREVEIVTDIILVDIGFYISNQNPCVLSRGFGFIAVNLACMCNYNDIPQFFITVK